MLRLLPHTFAGSFRTNDSLSVTISSVRPIQRHFSKYDHSIISWFRMSKIDGSYSISLPNSSRKITSAVIGFLIEREATRFPTYFPIIQGITRLKDCLKIKAPCYQDFFFLGVHTKAVCPVFLFVFGSVYLMIIIASFFQLMLSLRLIWCVDVNNLNWIVLKYVWCIIRLYTFFL